MRDTIVGFEVAKLAREKGFDEECFNYYFEDGEFREHVLTDTYGYYGEEYTVEFEALLENWNTKFLTRKNGDRCFGCSKSQGYLETFSAPTQSLLQKGLREKHDLYVYVIPMPEALFENENRMCTYRIASKNELHITKLFNSFEEALEEGLKQALKLIK